MKAMKTMKLHIVNCCPMSSQVPANQVRAALKGTNLRAQTGLGRTFSQILTDFGKISTSREQRETQIFVEIRRNPEIRAALNLVSLRDYDVTIRLNVYSWKRKTIYHHRGAQILADPAKAMVEICFSCVFQDLGIYRRLGDPELDFALGRWW